MNGWAKITQALSGFGGEPISLTVHKSGLPFLDALQLYGALDLYIGVREDISINDRGDSWHVTARRRAGSVRDRDRRAFQNVWKKVKPSAEQYCAMLRARVIENRPTEKDLWVDARQALSGLDSALQAGVRGVAASRYETLQTSQTSDRVCIADLPLSQGVLAYAGKRRVGRVGEITFLPIFQGPIDLSKVVSPLRVVNPFGASLVVPNVLCAQTLALLALRSSLLGEGYADQLSQVVFNTNLPGQRSDNYSGTVSIRSTAIGKMRSGDFVEQVYRTFKGLVQSAWRRRGREYDATEFAPDAICSAYWLMQPVPKHLSGMVLSIERMHARGMSHFLHGSDEINEVFNMSYRGWNGDYEALRKLARAVASGIYQARMAEELRPEKPGAPDEKRKAARKAWYDEVTMLRSAPSLNSFFERALILIEQGHREHDGVGTDSRNEAFDPAAVTSNTTVENFEAFKTLFRMYLVQESTYRGTEARQPA